MLGLNACLLRFASFGIRAQVLKSVFYPFYLLFPVIIKKKRKEKEKWNKKEMVIIENIMEDSIEGKYEDESTTHNP